MRKFKNLIKTVAIKNKKFIFTLCPALYINIKVFNLFKCNLIIYIYCIANTNNIAIRNCCFWVLVYLVSFAFKDNKKWDNMAVYIYYFYNYNRFIVMGLA